MNPNIYNNSGALTDLLNGLKEKSVFGFNSIDKIIDYKRNYQNEIQKIKNEKLNEILQDIEILEKTYDNLIKEYEVYKNDQILKINNEIEQLKLLYNNLGNNLFNKIKKHFLKKKLNKYELKYDYYIELPLKKYKMEIDAVNSKLFHLKNNQEDEINKRANESVSKIEYTISVFNSFSNLIYGSIGELKAIELLKQLPEQYYIINDFRKTFNPPIYNRNENDRIYSIQIDHIVVGPTGVYIIETKYWNQKSIESNLLFSPVKQLKRSSYALFILLNDIIRNNRIAVFSNNWGQFKISISNILLMMNASTEQQFQYIKILTENNLLYNITRGKVVFNEEQIKYIVKILK